MKPRQQRLSEYYARRAREYDRIYERAGRQDELRRLREEVSGHFTDRDVLEIACGTGYWTQAISRQASAILASDCNPEVLEVARERSYGSCRVRFRQVDAYSLSGIPTAFDAGFCGFWWSHVPIGRLDEFLAGFHTKLRLGARVCFLDNVYVDGDSTPISREDENGDTFQIRSLVDGSQYEVLKNFPSRAHLFRKLSRYASDVRIVQLANFWAADYTLDKRQAQKMGARRN